jgi:hypothetical protein
MYKQFGGSAFAFVLISALVSNLGSASHTFGSGKSNPPEPASNKSGADTATAIEADTHKCAAVEILRRHFGVAEQQPTELHLGSSTDTVCGDDSSFSEIPFAAPNGKNPFGTVFIATVPNPLQTANSLEFDRDIEALQEAASTCGYDFESVVTEWSVSNLAEPKGASEAREAEHYRRLFGDQPGAMLFHRRPASNSATIEQPQLAGEYLLLLLVPESPTYGLNMHAALEALAAIEALKKLGFVSGPGDSSGQITWIGPNYSASAYGLKYLVYDRRTILPFNAFSGSISSRPAIDALMWIDQNFAKRDSDVTAFEADEAALNAIRDSGVLGQENDGEIALLKEDESAYGGVVLTLDENHSDGANSESQPTTDIVQPPVFHFPRGISHIRGIFGSQLTNFKPSDESTKAQDAKPAFDLGDSIQQPLDTAPEFAAQSPYSNEGVLAGIASSMVHREIKAIVILATDPLDQLFLARYFHQKIPDARLVLFNAERLLPDLRLQYDLDGTLTVTKFPLFEDSLLQTPTGSRHSLIFMNSTQEGIFFAALHQIAPHKIIATSSLVPNMLVEPPIWIGISSGGSFWPIEQVGAPKPNGAASVAKDSYVVTDVPSELLPGFWVLIMSLVLLGGVVHILLFLAAQPFNEELLSSTVVWGKLIARHRVLTFYLPCVPCSVAPHEADREIGRRYWLLAATVQLVFILSYVLLPAGFLVGLRVLSPAAFHAGLKDGTTIFGMITFCIYSGIASCIYLATIVLLVVLVIDLCRFCHTARREHSAQDPFIAVFLLSLSLVWLCVTLFFLLRRLLDPSFGEAFALRCLHLASGVSPVLPLLLASIGFIIAAIVNLNALALARDRDPQMPDIGMDVLKLGPCKEQLRSYIECWGILPNPQGLVLSFFVVVTCLVVHPWQLFGSVDGRGLTSIFALNVVFGLWTIAWLWVRFLAIWKLLRFVLEALEGSPLRFAFSRLPRVFSLAPIWSYAGLRRTLILPMRWLEYFRVTPKQSTHKERLEYESKLLNEIAGRLLNDQVLIEGDYIHFNRDQNRYAAELAVTMPGIKASWKQGGPDAQSDASDSNKDSFSDVTDHHGFRSRIDVPAPCGKDVKDNCSVGIANEYIAMRFGAYVRYVTLQLKNLMTFMSVGLLLFLLATVSYPFRQPQRIAWSLIVIVAILLFGVGKVLVQMDRDSILSRMSETPPGKVDRSALLWHMLSVGGLPAITALSALFPSVGNFFFSWLQPVLSSLH